jgi:hypothetical protein
VLITTAGLLADWRLAVKFTVSEGSLWLRHRDSSATQRKGTSAVGSRYQRTGDDTADREDSACCIVLRDLPVVCSAMWTILTSCKCPINPVINPNPVCSHCRKRHNNVGNMAKEISECDHNCYGQVTDGIRPANGEEGESAAGAEL